LGSLVYQRENVSSTQQGSNSIAALLNKFISSSFFPLSIYVRNSFQGDKEIKTRPKGNNFLISGPNGLGRSAIVDAVDFLLNGDVSKF
jgi:hypothetical protein